MDHFSIVHFSARMGYMFLKAIAFQHFRSYEEGVFRFDAGTTVVVGANAAGKTNFLEAIYLLSLGKSFRAEKDWQLLQFGKEVGRVKGAVEQDQRSKIKDQMLDDRKSGSEEISLEVTLAPSQMGTLQKRYLVNGVARRRVDFAGKLLAVLFVPTDMDLVGGSPSLRRSFLDDVLEQVDLEYRVAMNTYTKAIRQRNALLEQAQESGVRNDRLFAYWDELLITNGQLITEKRAALIDYINDREKEFFSFSLVYDSSVISEERLVRYKQAELGAGVTLVGPHRDDMHIQISNIKYQISNMEKNSLVDGLREAKYFASRGQQRLVVLELKLAQIAYIEEKMGERPILLLDDIFSELDSGHIEKVLEMVQKQQTIVTTTHKEFVERLGVSQVNLIELTKSKDGKTEKGR